MTDAGPIDPQRRQLPEELRRELERLVRRWQELPADRAFALSGEVDALAARCADDISSATHKAAPAMTQLQPSASLDRLASLVYDLGLTDPCLASALTADLAALRRVVG